jgi:hypothetical protein
VRCNSVHYEDITSEGGYGPVLYNVARDCSVWSVAGDNRRPLESHLILHGTPSARTRAQFTRGAERVHRQLACLHQGHGRVHRQGHPRRSSVRRGRQCLLPMLDQVWRTPADVGNATIHVPPTQAGGSEPMFVLAFRLQKLDVPKMRS